MRNSEKALAVGWEGRQSRGPSRLLFVAFGALEIGEGGHGGPTTDDVARVQRHLKKNSPGYLDWLEAHLTGRTWLVGHRLTEADIRLFTTPARFDAVYVGHFKCNLRRIADYPALSGFVDAMLAVPGVAETINLEHIKRHYYESHRHINPTGVVPLGPVPPLV